MWLCLRIVCQTSMHLKAPHMTSVTITKLKNLSSVQWIIKTLVNIKVSLLRTLPRQTSITLLSQVMKSKKKGLVQQWDWRLIYSHIRARRSQQTFEKDVKALKKLIMKARGRTQSNIKVVHFSSDLTKLHICRPLMWHNRLQSIHRVTIIILTDNSFNRQKMTHLHP